MAKKYNDQDGVWRTIGGRRVFIKNGQSLSDAMKESGKFKKASDVTREEYQRVNAKQKVKEAQKEKLDYKKKSAEESEKLGEKYKQAKKDLEDLEKAYESPDEMSNTKDLEGKHVAESKPVKEYTSDFHLEAEVNDFDSAQAYLTSDDMTQYIPEELQGAVSKVEWTLDDESSGHVSVQTTRDLTDDEKAKLQDWIDGQNSDGLGEGFEQQEFAESYYNPYTGDGPYTYREAEREIESMYEDMDPSEYADYISEGAIEGGMERWMEDHDMDHIEDDETYEEARQDILDDPESYLEWEDIDDAKNEAMAGDDQYNLDSWYNMSSLKRTNDGFTEKSLAPETTEEKIGKDLDLSKENDRFMAKNIALNDRDAGRITDEEYQNKINEIDSHAGAKTYNVSELEQGKPYEIDMGNGIKKTAIFMGKDEDGNNAFYDGEGVSGAFAFSDKFMNERVKVTDNKDDDKFMQLHNEVLKQGQSQTKEPDSYKDSMLTSKNNNDVIRDLEQRKEQLANRKDRYTQEQYKEQEDGLNAGIEYAKQHQTEGEWVDKNIDQLKREYKQETGKEPFENGRATYEFADYNTNKYDEFVEKMKNAKENSGSGEFLENNKRWADNIGEKAFQYLTNEEKQKVLNGTMSVGEAYDKGATREMAEQNKAKGIDKSSRNNGLNSKEDYEHDLRVIEELESKYPSTGGLKNNEDYQSLKEQYESAFGTKWNGPGEEKTHKNVFNRSDAEIDDAIQTFNDFKQYETFSNDEWNYADQKRRDKLAGDAIRNYLADNHITRGEMLDLADVMENENHNTEASLVEKIYDEIHNTKGSNDWIKNAYEEYKEKHPKSKLSLADFTKKNKK